MQARALGVILGLVTFVPVADAGAGGGMQGGVRMTAMGAVPTPIRATVSLSGLATQTADINMDRVADQEILVDASGQARAAVRDLDFDGRADLVEFFAASGEVVERQFQMDFDPFVDVVRLYEGNRLTQKLVTTSFDGSLSLEMYYDIQGKLAWSARDTNFDGKADLREYYSDGSVVNRTRDQDGDGEYESIEEIESK